MIMPILSFVHKLFTAADNAELYCVFYLYPKLSIICLQIIYFICMCKTALRVISKKSAYIFVFLLLLALLLSSFVHKLFTTASIKRKDSGLTKQKSL